MFYNFYPDSYRELLLIFSRTIALLFSFVPDKKKTILQTTGFNNKTLFSKKVAYKIIINFKKLLNFEK